MVSGMDNGQKAAKRIRNPLRKRYPRELKEELPRYLIIFLLMLLSIGFISGYNVADESMVAAYNGGFENITPRTAISLRKRHLARISCGG